MGCPWDDDYYYNDDDGRFRRRERQLPALGNHPHCLWLSLERHGNVFSRSFACEGTDTCDRDWASLVMHNESITIDMPEQVNVGLAVSSGMHGCYYAEADFDSIECRRC